MSGMTEEAAWAFWFGGAFVLSCALMIVAIEDVKRWLKPIIAAWCVWVLPPFVAAWVRLVLS
jgi:hypothetical protein